VCHDWKHHLLHAQPLAPQFHSCAPAHARAQTLVELVHFARKTISAEQLVHCINLLASISASSGLPPSVQIMCVRVVLGLTGESTSACARQPASCLSPARPGFVCCFACAY